MNNSLSFFYFDFLTTYEVLWILIRFLRSLRKDVFLDKLHPWFWVSILWKSASYTWTFTLHVSLLVLSIVWFQKISIHPPRREREILRGWGIKDPGNSCLLVLSIILPSWLHAKSSTCKLYCHYQSKPIQWTLHSFLTILCLVKLSYVRVHSEYVTPKIHAKALSSTRKSCRIHPEAHVIQSEPL